MEPTEKDKYANQSTPQPEKKDKTDDAGYTEQEEPFADGKGTQLAEEFDERTDEEPSGDGE